MSAQLKLKNCKNKYDTRQNHRKISSPVSDLRLSGRGSQTAALSTRHTRLRGQSLPQPSRLPAKNVNKNSRHQGGRDTPSPGNSTSKPSSTHAATSKPSSTHVVRQNQIEKESSSPLTTASPTPANVVGTGPGIIAQTDGEQSQDMQTRGTGDTQSGSNSLTPATQQAPLPTGHASSENSLNLQGVNPGAPDAPRSLERRRENHLPHSLSDPCLSSCLGKSGTSVGYAHAPAFGFASTRSSRDEQGGEQAGQHELSQQDSAQFLKFLESNPSAPWHMAFHQLKSMGGRMAQLDTIQESTDTLKSQMSQVLGRTLQLETNVQNNTSEIQTLKRDIISLKQTITQQNETIDQLQQAQKKQDSNIVQQISEIKQSLETHRNTTEQQLSKVKQVTGNQEQNTEKQFAQIKQMMDKQEKKTEQLSSLRHKIRADTEEKLQKHEQELALQALIKQASSNRNNLVITGVDESSSTSAASQASQFFKEQLQLDKLQIKVAYRLGKAPDQDSSYSRPILVKFKNVLDRNTVWKKRKEIKQDKNGQLPRIQADLPKQLREDLHLMYRVVNAASTYEGLHTAEVRNYKVLLNGKEFSPTELEDLPEEIRPSTISTKYSNTTLVFFTKHTCLSNHFPATFKFDGQLFSSMEHLLAFKRAQISKDSQLIQRASNIKDPAEAKTILNILKNDHTEEWREKAPGLALQGPRAKFKQNPHMADYLCSTQPLCLGEASKDPVWGTGLQLDDAETLNQSKWIKSGNLLGKTLMKVRNEIVNKRGTPEN